MAACEVGEHQDMEQLGAGSRPEGVEALPEAALELIGSHRGSLRRREDCPRRHLWAGDQCHAAMSGLRRRAEADSGNR